MFFIAIWLFTFVGCFFLRLFQWLSPLKNTAELKVLLMVSYISLNLMIFFDLLVSNRFDIVIHDLNSLYPLFHEIATGSVLIVSGAIGVLLIIVWRMYFKAYYATYLGAPLISFFLQITWNHDMLLVFLRKYLQKHFPDHHEYTIDTVNYFIGRDKIPFLCLERKKLAKYLPIYQYELSFEEHPQMNSDAFGRLARAIYREIPWNWIRNLVLPLLLVLLAFFLKAILAIEWDILVPFLVFCIWGGLFFPLIEPQRNKNFGLFLLRQRISTEQAKA